MSNPRDDLSLFQFRAVPLVLGIGAGVALDTYFKLPSVEPHVQSLVQKVKELSN